MPPDTAPGRRPSPAAASVGLLLIIAASAAMYTALRLFAGDDTAAHGTAWQLWITAVSAMAVGISPWGGRRRTPVDPIMPGELLMLGAIFCVGLAFRLHRLDTEPYGVWFDEAANGLEAQKILADPSYRPLFVAGISQMAAMFFYYCAGFIELFGADIYSLRLATTVLGMAAVVGVWLLGRELWGRDLALIAAALLAVSRWHVNFSRFAMAQITMTVFIPIVLWLFTRALRRESARCAVWAGLVLGIGLQFYYAMMALPALAGVVAGRRLLQRDAPRWRVIALLALTLGAAAFSYSPVAQWASQHPEQFNLRMSTVSVFKTVSIGETLRLLTTPSPRRDQVLADIQRSAIAHAKMFHVAGDRNGRHNLPGHPMLDPITGACFAIGLALCVVRFWEPRKLMLLAWFGAMISSGILSLPFEAPQAGRSIGNTAAIALIAALPLAGSIAWARARGPLVGRIAVTVVAIALGIAAISNWTTYFERQLRNPAAWAAWSTAETKIGRTAAALTENTDLYVPAVYSGVPTIRSLASGKSQATRFSRDNHLPLPPTGRDAIVFVHWEDPSTLDIIRGNYPDATIEPFALPNPAEGTSAKPILWLARIPRRGMEALRGWEVTTAIDGESASTHQASTVWTWRPTAAGEPRLRVRGRWRVERDGQYELTLAHAGPAELRVDRESILSGAGTTSVPLARGLHEIDLTMSGGDGRARLLWRLAGDHKSPRLLTPGTLFMPAPGGGLLGRYVRGNDCEAEPAFSRIDADLALRYHAPPLPHPFAVKWLGSIHAPISGTYELFTRSVAQSTLRIDGERIISNEYGPPEAKGRVNLDAGWHDIDVCLRSGTDRLPRLLLEWKPPRGRRHLVRSAALRPPGPRGRRLDRHDPAPDL